MVNYTDMIEINSISNFDLNFDSCTATINAALKGEQRKGLWSVVYKVSNKSSENYRYNLYQWRFPIIFLLK
ncbi:hypothetical protein [Campylobacter jejuni]|uniref:hypothetical protein n=2 Tax=Campylobacter jejuni TaxID=197 RepID=UPI0002588F1A|nr:hypothetical protein [Campylobacter jejuni]EIB55327.1 putative periplasmic protein [Campylobacter jejuni subsp. jejuni 2008-979]BDL76270.1 hypothetical protein THJ020_04150 [Campylobacter jejuni]BEJ92350.1 hypothetical protein B10570_04170 [Campylobacter jejuni]GML71410.1 hypothetical protein B10628_04610 [Campylobacter jejuni]GML79372.1 hypothetical protein B11614_09950 [Campylobacter jejuni]